METVASRDHDSAALTFVRLAAKTAGGKGLAEDLLDIGKRKTQRAIRKGLDTGEDYFDEARYYIKRHPWRGFGIAAGIGAFAGLIIGLCTSPRQRVKPNLAVY